MTDGSGGLQLIRRPRPGSPPRPRVPQVERSVLENGLRIAAVHRSAVPQVAIRVVLPAGSASDPEAFPGTAAFVGAMLSEGTARFSAEELNARLDALGASLSVQVAHDFVDVDLVLLSETLSEGLELLGEVLVRPTFPRREVERTRAETLDSLAARLDEPANVADDRTSVELFGALHPYGRLTCGTPAGVADLPLEELERFHAAHYRPDGAIFLVAGDFDPEQLRIGIESSLGDWSGSATPLQTPPPPLRPERAGSRVSVPWPDAAQGEIRLAGAGLARSSPDWVPAAVANYLLGGSTITGRLGANLREDKGWTYGIRSGFAAALQPGGWTIETAVDVEVVERAFEEIEIELRRFTDEVIPDVELRRAKDALILSLPRAFETPARIVSRIATVEAFGLEQDYWERFPTRVEEVSAEDVRRIAVERFQTAHLVQVVVGT